MKTEKLEKLERLYEGKAKIAYSTADPEVLIFEFKDDATAFDGKKRGRIQDKGRINAQISAKLFSLLEEGGIRTHFRGLVGERDMLALRLEMIPFEVVVRNVAAGSLSKRLGIQEGKRLDFPVLEFYYKSDELGDPMINAYHIRALKLASEEEVREIEGIALLVNEKLSRHLAERGLELVDFKLEFGRKDGQIYLGDEISPDTCRLWDIRTGEKLDKDRFRRDLGGVEEAYQEVLARLG